MKRQFRFAALGAVVLILLGVLAATPVGSVLADELLQFFARVQGNSLPLQPEQIMPPVPTSTPEPTHALAIQPATEVTAALPTATLVPTLTLDPADLADASLIEAQTAAGWRLYAPRRLPRDYRLTRILYDSDQQSVQMQYASPQAGSGEFFQITQGRSLEPLSVGADAQVENVAIGPYNAEFVRGTWLTADGADQSTWEGNAEVYTLRWQAEEVFLSIQFFLNDAFYPAYLERDEILAVAQDMARCEGGDYACQVDQAAAAAGFTPWQFPAAPEGLSFDYVDYRPGLTAVEYGHSMDRLSLVQSTQDFATQEENTWFSVPEDAVQSLEVAGQPGEYVRGQFMARPGESQAEWNADVPVERLRWKNGDWWFQLVKTGGEEMQASALADLAAQLTNDDTQVQADGQDSNSLQAAVPGVYTDLASLEAAAGFDVLEPGVLPEGLPFSHARYEAIFHSVMLLYGNFAPDKIHADGPVLLLIQAPRPAQDSDPSGYYPPEAIQAVEVNGQAGYLITGSMETFMAEEGQPTPAPVWHADSGGLALHWNSGEWQFDLRFDPTGHGARIGMEDLLEIAASLQ
ncbi:MAG: hypothetical protein VB089_21010 [Anaerolineaceae bacterium]|nr:hypothetical protein [Anaerolineaceae bacterium]